MGMVDFQNSKSSLYKSYITAAYTTDDELP